MTTRYQKVCQLCGKRYFYSASAYGFSIESINHGATRHVCSRCFFRLRWYHRVWWAWKDVVRSLRIRWFYRHWPKMNVHRVEQKLISTSIKSVEPMKKQVGMIFYRGQ